MPNTELNSLTNSESASEVPVHVAVGVVLNRDRQVLIARRHQRQHQGGLWEFPGGKVGAGESVQDALRRELLEEVNLTVRECARLLSIPHDYGDKKVLLDVWIVNIYSGEATGREGQPVKWASMSELDDHDFPDANQAIISALKTLLYPV
jgi:8-oxo-dGTP diphosphatase